MTLGADGLWHTVAVLTRSLTPYLSDGECSILGHSGVLDVESTRGIFYDFNSVVKRDMGARGNWSALGKLFLLS